MADNQDQPVIYERRGQRFLDVYALAPEVSPGLVNQYRENNPQATTRYVALTTGPYAAFAVVELPVQDHLRQETRALSGAPGLLEDVFKTPGPGSGDQTLVPAKNGPRMLRRSLWQEFGAFVGIRVEKGKAEDVLRDTARVSGYAGSAIVLGAYDVLVDVGAPTYEELVDRLFAITSTDGVVSTDSLLVTDQWHRDEEVMVQAQTNKA
jgi:hypothetical protein